MPTHAATYPEVDELLDLIDQRIRGVLGAKLLGLYLTGSLVTGDFDPAVSDVDLLAVTSAALRRRDVEALAAMHTGLVAEAPRWENRIEVAYLSRAALRRFRSRTSTMAVTSPGEPFHTKPAGRDWLFNWYVVREKGVALYGPAPETFIEPISHSELIKAVGEVAEWRRTSVPRHRNGQVFTILTMCRALHTVTTGGLASKKEAATWAAEALPEWAPLIESTLTWWREHWYDEDVDHAAWLGQTERFVEDVARRIASLR